MHEKPANFPQMPGHVLVCRQRYTVIDENILSIRPNLEFTQAAGSVGR